MRYAGANGRLTLRADSGFYTHGVVSVCRKMDVRFSITIRQHKSLRNLIEAIPEADWTPIPYWMDGAADVAETTRTPFQSEPDAAPVRLIVRRVKPTPGSQLALFASYSYHGFITDRDGETLELEADHRRHAEVENAIRDLKYGVGLNHLPSGRFAANGAWLAVQVMAHNLARWTARIGLGEQVVTTKTLRRRFFSLAGRITRSARRLTLHLPQRWPWEGAVQPRPGPIARPATPCLTAASATGRHQANRTSPRTRASPVCQCLLLRPLPAISPSPTFADGHKVSPRQLKTDTGPPLPQIVPGPSPSLAPHRPFRCCIVIPSVDLGLGGTAETEVFGKYYLKPEDENVTLLGLFPIKGRYILVEDIYEAQEFPGRPCTSCKQNILHGEGGGLLGMVRISPCTAVPQMGN